MYLRPLYELPDARFDHLMVSDPATWERAGHLARHTALAEPLDGLEVDDFEHSVLEWLAGQEASTVAVIVALLWRARQSAIIPVGVGAPPFDGTHPIRTEGRPATRPTGDAGASAHLHGPQVLFTDVIILPVRADSAEDGAEDAS
jgi:hypothetical protein